MASSKTELTEDSSSKLYHCKCCGNTFEEFFLTMTNHSSESCDVTHHVMCLKCDTADQILQVDQHVPDSDTIPVFPSRKDTPCAANDLNRQSVENTDDIPVFPRRETCGGDCCSTAASDRRRSRTYQERPDVIVSRQANIQAAGHSSPANLEVDLIEMKYNFYRQACSCGNSDRADFMYVADNEDGEIIRRECMTCGDTIGIDDTTYDEVLSWLDKSADVRMSVCACGNDNPFTFIFERIGNNVFLRCGQCETPISVSSHNADPTETESMSEGDDAREDYAELGGVVSCCDLLQRDCACQSICNSTEVVSNFDCPCDGHPCGWTKIEPTSTWKLNPGDHVAWHRPIGYWHHAIVVRRGKFDDTAVLVIQYGEPSEHEKYKGKVIENWINLTKERGDFYRLEYNPEKVFDSDTVIQRGRSRLGEVDYQLFRNNCEHFARWCKTGVAKSKQVESVATMLTRTLGKAVVVTTAKTARGIIQRTISGIKTDALKQIMSNWKVVSGKLGEISVSAPKAGVIAKNLGKVLVRKRMCDVLATAASCTVIVGIELCSMIRDLRKTKSQLRPGDNSSVMYANIVEKRLCSISGTVAGSALGTIIPVPVVGTLIGSTLGNIIGEGIGQLAQRRTS